MIPDLRDTPRAWGWGPYRAGGPWHLWTDDRESWCGLTGSAFRDPVSDPGRRTLCKRCCARLRHGGPPSPERQRPGPARAEQARRREHAFDLVEEALESFSHVCPPDLARDPLVKARLRARAPEAYRAFLAALLVWEVAPTTLAVADVEGALVDLRAVWRGAVDA